MPRTASHFLIALAQILMVVGASPSHAFVNSEQSKKITAALNDACKDAWCEGPYEIAFESIRCSRVNHNCIVHMQLKDPELSSTSTNFSCLIEALDTADDVFLEKPVSGQQATFVVPGRILLSSIPKCIAAYQP